MFLGLVSDIQSFGISSLIDIILPSNIQVYFWLWTCSTKYG